MMKGEQFKMRNVVITKKFPEAIETNKVKEIVKRLKKREGCGSRWSNK